MSEYFGIDLTKLENVYAQCVEVDEVSADGSHYEQDIVYVGMPNPYSMTVVGSQRALSTGLDNTIRIMFPKPVAEFSCYLSSLPEHPTVVPEATAWGYQRAGASTPVDVWMPYSFGPRRPTTGQYSAGTPANDEFRWSYIEIKNARYWRGKFAAGVYGAA